MSSKGNAGRLQRTSGRMGCFFEPFLFEELPAKDVSAQQASERDDGGEAEWRARIAAREPAVGKPSLSGGIYRTGWNGHE